MLTKLVYKKKAKFGYFSFQGRASAILSDSPSDMPKRAETKHASKGSDGGGSLNMTADDDLISSPQMADNSGSSWSQNNFCSSVRCRDTGVLQVLVFMYIFKFENHKDSEANPMATINNFCVNLFDRRKSIMLSVANWLGWLYYCEGDMYPMVVSPDHSV